MELKKTKITIEGLDHGKVHVSVDGVPYLVSESWLTNFNPGADEDRGAYSSEQCTDADVLHPNGACDTACHGFDCIEPAVFFQHWRTPDGAEHCMPVCKFHGRDMASYVGQAVLFALDYGVTRDLRFWTCGDPLPNGRPRCDCRYSAADEHGLQRARCTAVATQVVRYLDGRRQGNTNEARLCDRCVHHWIADDGAGREIEIVGPVSLPVLPSAYSSEDQSSGK